MNIQYLNCSEVIVITISHVHRIELLGISNFYHISFLEFTHKLSVITVHTHAIWITQITFIKETKRLSIYVKDVNTMVIHIYCQYTTLIVCCDTVVFTLDPSYKKHICVNDVYTVVITIGIWVWPSVVIPLGSNGLFLVDAVF